MIVNYVVQVDGSDRFSIIGAHLTGPTDLLLLPINRLTGLDWADLDPTAWIKTGDEFDKRSSKSAVRHLSLSFPAPRQGRGEHIGTPPRSCRTSRRVNLLQLKLRQGLQKLRTNRFTVGRALSPPMLFGPRSRRRPSTAYLPPPWSLIHPATMTMQAT